MPHHNEQRYRQMQERALILTDGATGTELERLVPDPVLPWSLDGLVRYPHLTQQVHEDYLEAGAQVITTNAFRTTQRTIERVDWEAVSLPSEDHPLRDVWMRADWNELDRALTWLSVSLADAARTELGRESACIAGNLAPLEDCFHPEKSPPKAEALPEHRRKARQMAEAGVDLLLLETMNAIPESEAALEAALDTGLPVWLSFVCRRDGCLISGEPLAEALAMANAHLPSRLDAVLVNCCFPEEADQLLPVLVTAALDVGLRFGAYANLEAPDLDGVWQRRSQLTATSYVEFVNRWVNQGATIVGGCCGTTPADIVALHEAFTARA